MYMQLLNYRKLRTFYAFSVHAHDGMYVLNGLSPLTYSGERNEGLPQ